MKSFLGNFYRILAIFVVTLDVSNLNWGGSWATFQPPTWSTQFYVQLQISKNLVLPVSQFSKMSLYFLGSSWNKFQVSNFLTCCCCWRKKKVGIFWRQKEWKKKLTKLKIQLFWLNTRTRNSSRTVCDFFMTHFNLFCFESLLKLV